MYADINNGAYRAGFASEQAAYDVAFKRFFAALDRAEAILQGSRHASAAVHAPPPCAHTWLLVLQLHTDISSGIEPLLA